MNGSDEPCCAYVTDYVATEGIGEAYYPVNDDSVPDYYWLPDDPADVDDCYPW